MKIRAYLLVSFVLLCLYGLHAQRGRVEAIEIHSGNAAELPQGKEADGIVGDFVLRNDRVVALISGAQPLRRANMTTEYGTVLQGCLFDLDLRGENNDQITAFRPGGESGEVSWVQITGSGSPSAAAIEVVRTAAKGGGLYTRHVYQLESGWQHVEITTVYRNEGSEAATVTPSPAWKGLEGNWRAGEILVGDSVDPFDKRGYAWGPLPGSEPFAEEITLAAGEEKTFRSALAVGDSPLSAYGVIAALRGDTGEVIGTAVDSSSEPAIHGALWVETSGVRLPQYPDGEGRFRFQLPPGSYQASFEDIGRPTATETVEVRANQSAALRLELETASAVSVEINDQSGQPLPGKVQFIGVDGTPTPDFGTEYRTRGGDHQHQTHTGRFTQQAPPGAYLLRITRGPEYDLDEQRIEVAAGQRLTVRSTLRRSVDTRGWVSTDFHAHSTPSGDNYCNTDDRIINFAAEHIEFAPTTEHNRLYDWEPHIGRLGLSGRLKTVIGIELTGPGQHFNAFPFERDPLAQDGGAPVWNYDPRINAIVLRNWGTPSLEGGSTYDTAGNIRKGLDYFGGGPDRWVQANHPIVSSVFFDRNRDGVRDGGFTGFERLIDAAEVWSTEILNLQPTYMRDRGDGAEESENRTFGWLQMLNQGRHVWCVAVSDAHRIFGNGVGGWRTYVPSSTDNPAEIDAEEIVRNAKAGRMMITNGPFLEVTTGDGLPIGSNVIAPGYIDLKIRVQAPNWIEIGRVQVLVNGRQPREYNFTAAEHPGKFRDGVVRFDEAVRVHLQEDAHLIVVATDENSDISKGWGRNPYGRMHPVAYTNPIYVDTGRDGFQANGDTLGHPLPSARRDTD